MGTHPEAFALLHIPDVTLAAGSLTETGTLALECVTLAPDNVPEKEKEIARSGRVLTHDTDRTEGR